MADNTTLYIVIGIVLLFALMGNSTDSYSSGSPGLSAYVRPGVKKSARKGRASA